MQYIDHDLPAEPAVKACTVIDDTVHIPQNLSRIKNQLKESHILKGNQSIDDSIRIRNLIIHLV